MIARETTLDKIRSRPRFKMASRLTKEEYLRFLRKNFENSRNEFEGRITAEESVITVNNGQYDYWKPQLALTANNEDGQTVIRGIFGPSSAVWTFFMFLYFALGILWMVFITLWFVGTQIKTDDFTWCLPVSFLMIICLALVYLAARFGQNKAKAEMKKLRTFAEQSLLPHETTVNS